MGKNKKKKTPMGFCSNKEYKKRFVNKKDKREKRGKDKKHAHSFSPSDLTLIGTPFELEYEYKGL